MKMQNKFNRIDELQEECTQSRVIFANSLIQSWDIFKKYRIEYIFLKNDSKELILTFGEWKKYIRFTYSAKDDRLLYSFLMDFNDDIKSYKKNPEYNWYVTWNKFPIFIYMMEGYDRSNKERNLVIDASFIDERYYITADHDIWWSDTSKEFKIRENNHGIMAPIQWSVYTPICITESMNGYNHTIHEDLSFLQNDGNFYTCLKFAYSNLKNLGGIITDAENKPILYSSIKFVSDEPVNVVNNKGSVDIVIPENVLNNIPFIPFNRFDEMILYIAKTKINFEPSITRKIFPCRIWYTEDHSYAHMLINPKFDPK